MGNDTIGKIGTVAINGINRETFPFEPLAVVVDGKVQIWASVKLLPAGIPSLIRVC